ncbi:DUF4126 domain-containing protein [Flavobacterium sp.]|uniref:DUF4126 domain-containing protein n=1 Tax=Flavobacterium sp. TaxID=239 RepID=UPI0028BEB537|nr:DUF4126 domain-containing protein [Flavobacterium sp.]
MSVETIISLFLGIGLAASTGFRVFLPLFALSLASHYGVVPLNESWEWIGGMPALIALGIAMIVEIAAYYIPFVDNLLDAVAIPLAAIAGTAVMASTLVDVSPLVSWGLAIIAGGGTATAITTSTAATRLASSAKTGGIGNSVVSTAETGTALTLSSLSIFVPIVALLFVLLIFVVLYKVVRKFRK